MSGACYYGGPHEWRDAQVGDQQGIQCVKCQMFIPK